MMPLVNEWVLLVLSAAFIMILFYDGWLARWTMNWIQKTDRSHLLVTTSTLTVSVVVAVRNESQNILKCLDALLHQSYDPSLTEFLISDDFSDDNTGDLIISEMPAFLSKGFALTLIEPVAGDLPGKKEALARAIMRAKGKLILTTDADCLPGPEWIRSFASVQLAEDADMVTGFVKVSNQDKLFDKIQALEFLSLSGIGAMSVISNKPLMCNGANLAFTKEAFMNAGGYQYGNQIPTGDDTYLMLKIASQNDRKIVFNYFPQSVISTTPQPDFKTLIDQRIRWASKVKHYHENYIKRFGLLIFGVNLILLVLLVMTSLQIMPWQFLLAAWLLKAAGDFLVLIHTSAFAAQRRLLLLFLPVQVIYPFYSLVAAFFSLQRTNYQWKGRNFTN